ncbi:MAG: glycosyltransferase [Myxococcaceae bacterium]|nr:glycosyltransferase [Myxococcaceae bacterium]
MMVAALLIVLAGVGVTALLLGLVCVVVHVRRSPSLPSRRPGISILKPLCGADDELALNLERFATIEYPRFELLLGVRDRSDPAWPVAVAAARRHPRRVRVVLQRGVVGMNPKVNQLATLEREAKYDLLLVSDSNTRPPSGYLSELAALFEDPWVACATSPVSGAGHETFGALLDNLHLASAIGPGQIAARLLAGRDLVVGKSMALRRSALEALGGFAAFGDHLAEDYVIGRRITQELRLGVALARLPVLNVATRRTVQSFVDRYARWAVIHRTAVSLPTSLAQALLNPWPLTLVALALCPVPLVGWVSLATLVVKIALDVTTARALGFRGARFAPLAVPFKDLVLFIAWCIALFRRTVEWRGSRLRVGPGSKLVPIISEVPATEGRS